jgi:hypothetical protein
MCDCQNEHALRLKVERDEVRELLEKGLSDWSRSGFRARPDWIESRRSFETFQDLVDSFDEPVAQARALLFIPERSGTDFSASFRMKFDAHDGQQVRSGFPHVRLSTARATRVLPEHRPIDEEVPQPRRPRFRRPSPLGSTAVPPRYERVPPAITEAPLQAVRPSTSS